MAELEKQFFDGEKNPFQPLTEFLNEASQNNIFEILDIRDHELIHSKMLKYFLDPKSSHRLGDAILKQFLKQLCLLDGDFSDAIVKREWNNIDLLVVSEKNHFVLCLENKIFTGEHDDQLNRYKEIIEDTFPAQKHYKHQFVFLSANGKQSSSPDVWKSISYSFISEVIGNVEKKLEISEDVKFILRQYRETIRRYNIENNELKKICYEIYKNYPRELVAIFANVFRPENYPDVLSKYIVEWCQKNMDKGIIFNSDFQGVDYVSCRTDIMDTVLPCVNDKSVQWKNYTDNSFYYYKICFNDKKVWLQLQLAYDAISNRFEDVYVNSLVYALEQQGYKADRGKKERTFDMEEYGNILLYNEAINEIVLKDKFNERMNEKYQQLVKNEQKVNNFVKIHGIIKDWLQQTEGVTIVKDVNEKIIFNEKEACFRTDIMDSIFPCDANITWWSGNSHGSFEFEAKSFYLYSIQFDIDAVSLTLYIDDTALINVIGETQGKNINKIFEDSYGTVGDEEVECITYEFGNILSLDKVSNQHELEELFKQRMNDILIDMLAREEKTEKSLKQQIEN